MVKQLTDQGIKDIDTSQLLGTGKILLFAVPGAFTPTCSARHLPGYVAHADQAKAQGFDKIVCLAVNDPFVMKAWLEAHKASGIIQPLADSTAAFTRALGLTYDASAHGLGERAQRFAMIIEDGIVTTLDIEQPGQFLVSGAEHMLKQAS